MILARGEPTWWGDVQAWLIMNEDTIWMVLLIIAVVVAVLGSGGSSRRRRRR